MMTAAGVAGGLLLGNAIMGALGSGGAAEAATTGGFGQDAVPTSSAWGGQNDAQAFDQGGYGNDASAHDAGGYEDEEY
jgi:hypothetical protein